METPFIIFPTQVAFLDDDYLYGKLFCKNFHLKKGLHINQIIDISMVTSQGNNDFVFLDGTPDKTPICHRSDLKNKDLNICKNLNNCLSVVIADFHMDNLNGLDFFRTIKSQFIYKILVSNFIDMEYSKEINQAINEGVINAVLDKKYDFEHQIEQAIARGQNRFFSLLSNEILKNNDHYGIMTDPAFSSYFKDIINKIKPDYLWSNKSLNTFKLKNDKTGTQKSIFLTTPDEINLLVDSYQAETVPSSILEKIKSHSFMLACEDPYSVNGTDWPCYLRPATKIRGRSGDLIISACDGDIHA